MKKFLLSLAVSMTAVCGAFAQTVIKADQIDLKQAKTFDGFTVEVQKNNGSNAPAYNTNTQAVRIYAKGSMTISGEKITKVVITLASDAAQRYTEFTPNVGAINPAQAEGDTEITWIGDAASVTFTTGDNATMGTDGASKAGQIRFTELTIYGEGGSSVDPTPDPVDPTPGPNPGSEFDVNDATDIQGTLIEEELKEDGSSVKAAKHVQPLESFKLGDYTFTFDKSSGSTAPAYYWATSTSQNQDKTVRVYNGNTMTMTASSQLTAVTFNLAKAVTGKTITASTGTVTASADGKAFTWTGNAASFTLTFAASYQIRTIALGQGSTPVDPTPDPEIPTTGPGSADQPYTIAEAIAIDNNKSKGWVNGYIVGVMLYNEEEKANYFSSEVNGMGTNIVIAATTTETNTENMICVQLPAGKIREDLNLVDRPGNMGKEVSVCGSFEKYCGIHGVKNTSDYTIVGGLAPITVTETASLTTFVEEQSEDFMKITGAVTVFYQSPNKNYTFITDGESNLEIYGTLPEYHNGDQLTGIIGKYGFYKNMPQMTPQTDSFGAATAGTPVEPTEVAFNQINIAQYVKVIAIEIYEDGGKFYIGQGDAKRQVYDQFKIGGLKAGVCTITGIGAIYDTTIQIFPTELDYKNVNSIDEITAGAAKSEIFDLQGRKVTKASHGVYIVNGKKTFIR